MKRKLILTTIALSAVLSWVSTPPAAAQQAQGCKDFGQNISVLARTLGSTFGQVASSGAPLNDTVASEQKLFCR